MDVATELAPGIFRLESELGPRPFSQYLLRDERTLLVDTGIASTPAEVIQPMLAGLGVDISALDLVLISHADVDHFGGSAAIAAVAPRALFLAHVADAGWISDQDRIFRERYGWYAAHGPAVDYDAATWDWLRNAIGPDVPVDLGLTGGEQLRLGPNLTVEVLHLPGHSPGHVGLWEPRSRTAIVTDAVLGAGLIDAGGAIIQPPPYFDIRGYIRTIATLRELAPIRLLTAHFPVIEGPAVNAFLDASLEFIGTLRAAVGAAVRTGDAPSLAEIFERVNPVVGNFTAMPNELNGPIIAHLGELEESGLAVRVAPGTGEAPRWRWTGDLSARDVEGGHE